jgi:hypothetical protein
MTETRIAPTKAAVNEFTVKPCMTVPKNQNKIPFKTSENNPRVTILSGNVRRLRIGLTNILIRVKHAPTIRATHNGLTCTPDTT